MLENFFKTFCNTIIAQLKIPRKGALMLLLILSSIAIAINKWIFHYSIATKGSLLLQIMYFAWMYSFISIPIKAYNEYCNKKDVEKIKKEENKKAEEKFEKYFKELDYCDIDEKEILVKFYSNQTTSCYAKAKEINTIEGMRKKGIEFISYNGSNVLGGSMLTNAGGLAIINRYFDKDKPKFFSMLDNFEEKEIELLKDFVYNNDNQIEIAKKQNKIANSIINKFEQQGFGDIYIADFFTISNLYLAYLNRYFEETAES